MKHAIVALGLLAASGAAHAMTVDEADTDGDGSLSLVEIQAMVPDFTEESFATVDTDADGMLSEDEVTAAQAAGLLPEDGQG